MKIFYIYSDKIKYYLKKPDETKNTVKLA